MSLPIEPGSDLDLALSNVVALFTGERREVVDHRMIDRRNPVHMAALGLRFWLATQEPGGPEPETLPADLYALWYGAPPPAPILDPVNTWRAVVTVNGRPHVYGPYQDHKSAIRSGKMRARRHFRAFPLGAEPPISVQPQRYDGQQWVDVGKPIDNEAINAPAPDASRPWRAVLIFNDGSHMIYEPYISKDTATVMARRHARQRSNVSHARIQHRVDEQWFDVGEPIRDLETR